MPNNLGNLFNAILYNGLTNKLQNANILSPAQAGFRKDHIFSLLSLIKKYVTNDKYSYTCFVDFQKAYDLIRRDGLKDKLEKIGINGKFLEITHVISKTSSIPLLYKNKVAKQLYTTTWLKQSDILSTVFLNLFINNLLSLLTDTSNGNNEKPKLQDTNISLLLFVDNLTNFPFLQKELQTKINIVEEYYYNWDLELNIEKTKIKNYYFS